MSTEYVDDVPYVRHFLGDLSPARLRLVAALEGVAPPPIGELDYCELGCAHGDTLAALAAAHPEGRFLGIDINAAHIASAKRLARDGALENIGFLERDFESLLSEDVGEFDYVVAHGVISWVSPAKRAALMAFASAKLKPGGLLYVSYNAMPGWASVEPLRQLLLFPSARAGETTEDRARRGVELAQALERAGAEYFTANPSASEMLRTMAKAGLPYVVHEYMHEHWAPMYFARVAWELAEQGLHFVGSLPLREGFRDLALPAAVEPLLSSIDDRVTFESLKAFATNEFFRRDVYVKGRVARSADVTAAYLDETPFGTITNTALEERVVRLPHRTVSLEGPVFDAIFAALAEGSVSVRELVDRAELGGVSEEELRRCLVRLLVTERVAPRCAPSRAHRARADEAFDIPSVYNQMMLRRLSSEVPVVMTSTVAGTAYPISALDGLALRVFTEVPAGRREAWSRDFVRKNVLRIRVDDRIVTDEDEQQRAILEGIAALAGERLAKLVELGILAPRSASVG